MHAARHLTLWFAFSSAIALSGPHILPTPYWENCLDRWSALLTYFLGTNPFPQPPPRYLRDRQAPVRLPEGSLKYADGRIVKFGRSGHAPSFQTVEISPNSSYARTSRPLIQISAEMGWSPAEVITRLRGKKVLDLGCGGGRFVRDLLRRGVSAYGVDIILDSQQRRLPNVFVEGDSRHTGLEGQQFDVIVNSYTSGGYYDAAALSQTLSEAKRLLAAGGRFVIGPLEPENLKNAPEIVSAAGMRIETRPQILNPDSKYWLEIVKD